MTGQEFRNDPMFLRNQFLSDGVFEIPIITNDRIDLENINLIGYDKINDAGADDIVHFFHGRL